MEEVLEFLPVLGGLISSEHIQSSREAFNMLSVERQNGLTTSNLHTQLDPFASKLTNYTQGIPHSLHLCPCM